MPTSINMCKICGRPAEECTVTLEHFVRAHNAIIDMRQDLEDNEVDPPKDEEDSE